MLMCHNSMNRWYHMKFCKRFVEKLLIVLVMVGNAFGAPYGIGHILLPYNRDSVREINPQDGSSPQTLSLSPSVFSTSETDSGGGVALDDNLNLYVTVSDVSDTNSNSGIVVFNSNGAKVKTIDGGTIRKFRGLAIRDNIIYVATTDGIYRYNATTGESLGSFGTSAAYYDVAFDSTGNLFATTSTDVHKWNAGEFTGDGTALGLQGLTDARALAFDENGNLYVANGTNRNVKKYLKQGNTFQTSPVATITVPTHGNATVIGLAFDHGISTFYVSHTRTSANQIAYFESSVSGNVKAIAVSGTSGLSYARYLDVNPTPEPSPIALFGCGLILVSLLMRNRRRNGKRRKA